MEMEKENGAEPKEVVNNNDDDDDLSLLLVLRLDDGDGDGDGSSSSSSLLRPPWLNHLPEGIPDNILDRLPLLDYVRFAAVCSLWQSIQIDHRHRHRSSASGTCLNSVLNLPWLIPSRPPHPPSSSSLLSQESQDHDDDDDDDDASEQPQALALVHCFSPFEGRFYPLRFPFSPIYLHTFTNNRQDITFGAPLRSASLTNGWLLLDDEPHGDPHEATLTLINPISRQHFQLPILDQMSVGVPKAALSPPPNFVIFAVVQDHCGRACYLYRQGETSWDSLHEHSHFRYPFREDDEWKRDMQNDHINQEVVSPIFWHGMFFCFWAGRGLLVLDPADPRSNFDLFEMDQANLPPKHLMVFTFGDYFELYNRNLKLWLVESNGELLLVIKIPELGIDCDRDDCFIDFQVFMADFSNRVWVRKESLSDQLLVVYGEVCFSLSSPKTGAKGNCIYFPHPCSEESEPTKWRVFDLAIRQVTDSSLAYPPIQHPHLMFVPSIC